MIDRVHVGRATERGDRRVQGPARADRQAFAREREVVAELALADARVEARAERPLAVLLLSEVHAEDVAPGEAGLETRGDQVALHAVCTRLAV